MSDHEVEMVETPDETDAEEEPGASAADDDAELESLEGAQAEPQGEPDAPRPQGMSEKDIEVAMGKLEREAQRHRSRVAEIMGDDAIALVPCVLCPPHIAGLRFDTPVDDETAALVLAALGREQEREYAKASDAHVCEPCGGLGKVETGSLVPEHRTKLCSACGGTGWVHVPGPGATVTPIVPGAMTLPPVTPPLDESQTPDAWGRPSGHRDYGKLPSIVNA